MAGWTNRGTIRNEIIRKKLEQWEHWSAGSEKRLIGHIIRMDDKQLPTKALYCPLEAHEVRKDKLRHGWTP